MSFQREGKVQINHWGRPCVCSHPSWCTPKPKMKGGESGLTRQTSAVTRWAWTTRTWLGRWRDGEIREGQTAGREKRDWDSPDLPPYNIQRPGKQRRGTMRSLSQLPFTCFMPAWVRSGCAFCWWMLVRQTEWKGQLCFSARALQMQPHRNVICPSRITCCPGHHLTDFETFPFGKNHIGQQNYESPTLCNILHVLMKIL